MIYVRSGPDGEKKAFWNFGKFYASNATVKPWAAIFVEKRPIFDLSI